MSSNKLFQLKNSIAAELVGSSVQLIKSSQKNIENNQSNYCFGIERLYLKKKAYYFLFPFTIILDIITFPIQLLGLILLLIFIRDVKNQVIKRKQKRRNK